MAKARLSGDEERSLAIRAAWLHYVGGLRQAEVAKRLGVPSVKAHRLIARAVAEGAVKVTIEGEIIECIELGEAICARYGLRTCEVAPDLEETDFRSGRCDSPAPLFCAAGSRAARR